MDVSKALYSTFEVHKKNKDKEECIARFSINKEITGTVKLGFSHVVLPCMCRVICMCSF